MFYKLFRVPNMIGRNMMSVSTSLVLAWVLSLLLFYDILSCIFNGCRSSWCRLAPRNVRRVLRVSATGLTLKVTLKNIHLHRLPGLPWAIQHHFCNTGSLYCFSGHWTTSRLLSTCIRLSVILLTKTHSRTSQHQQCSSWALPILSHRPPFSSPWTIPILFHLDPPSAEIQQAV